jgi:hypothetical protein
MGRASGRKNLPRAPVPDSPEGDEIGESVRQDPAGSPIPGLTGNIANYETVRQQVPAGEPLPEFRGMMAHGVPPEDYTPAERAEAMRGESAPHQPPRPPKLGRERVTPPAVPVYIVTPAEGGRPLTTLSTAKVTIPANTNGQSVRICARDETRQTMYVLVETAAGAAGAAPTGIRIDHELSETDTGNGALLRAGMVSYQELKGCQDELFALSNDGSACTLSIIYLYGVAAAG